MRRRYPPEVVVNSWNPLALAAGALEPAPAAA